MWDIAESELLDLHNLVLRPTPSNLVDLVTRLDTVAAQVACLKAAAEVRGSCEPELAANLRSLQREMSRTQRMLSSAAAFYNGLANLRTTGTTGYERTGLLRSAASSGRVLAQL